MSRYNMWTKSEYQPEEYVSDFGIVRRDGSNGTWAALIKEGFGYRICGKGFTKVRSAMIAAEEAVQELKLRGGPLPPIQFPAHIFC